MTPQATKLEPRSDIMSDYCDCCLTNTGYIRHHYDPDGHIKPEDTPEDVLETFRGCFSGEACPLDLDDVKEYLYDLAASEVYLESEAGLLASIQEEEEEANAT